MDTDEIEEFIEEAEEAGMDIPDFGIDSVVKRTIRKGAGGLLDRFLYGTNGQAGQAGDDCHSARAALKDQRDQVIFEMRKQKETLAIQKLQAEIEQLKTGKPNQTEQETDQDTPSVLFGELPSIPISPSLQCDENPEDFTMWLESLVTRSCRIVILGSQGYGKSALGHALLEYLHHKTGRSAILYAPLVLNAKLLPNWLRIVDDWDSIPENALVLVDEAALMLNSRNPGCRANRDFTELSAISRHKNLSLIFVSQSSRSLDINAMSMGDLEIIFKKPPMFAGINERKEMKDLSKMAKKVLDKIDTKVLREYSVVFPSSYEPMLMKSGLSSYWSEQVSTMYKDCVGSSQGTNTPTGRDQEIKILHSQGKTQAEIAAVLGVSQPYISKVLKG